ncbi:hypothetical protein OTU49_011683 [Cherax quadricarinatus]|uniref:CCHC-type domain-containing protein n=1 Tax=Cherax quadricarinatus TaxID=27406 RepID=A0AAW0W2M8_CHEQU
MVRFARAEGSKGSNKRVLEEPTPWAEMMAQKMNRDENDSNAGGAKKKKKDELVVNRKSANITKEKSNKINKKDKIEEQEEEKPEGIKTLLNKCEGQEKKKWKKDKIEEQEEGKPQEMQTLLNKCEGQEKKKRKKDKIEEQEEGKPQEMQTLLNKCEGQEKKKRKKDKIEEQEEGKPQEMQILLNKCEGQDKKKRKKDKIEEQEEGKPQEMQILLNKCEGQDKKKRKKRKTDKENLSNKSKPEFVVNSKGERVKVFKDGTERTWFDLPYEDNERMTRYDGMWVKRKMAEKLESLKASLKEQGLEGKEIMRKMMKAKRKAHRQLRIELIYEQKELVSEQKPLKAKDTTQDETPIKLKKKGKKTKTKDVRNKPKEVVLEADSTCENQNVIGIANKSLDNETLNERPENHQSEELHKTYNTQERNVQDKGIHVNHSLSKAHQKVIPVTWTKGANSKTLGKSIANRKTLHGEWQTGSFVFEENDIMTQYEGYWVLREAVEMLNAASEEKLRNIYNARVENCDARELTGEEQIIFQRAMKKEKRFYNRKLMIFLSRGTGQRMINKHSAHEQKGSLNSVENQSKSAESVVKFDGFWVKKESADRLNKLKERLTAEGVSAEELYTIMQKERRKEERLLKNERKLVCLKCRKPGHMVSSCPEATGGTNDAQITICYTCGSTEHTSRDCTLKQKGSVYSHATCFICGEVGHISRECPDNPRGLYPNGGACRGCGSVEHLAKDCPDLKKEKEKANITLSRIDGSAVETLDVNEAEEPLMNTQVSPHKKNKIKMVTF